MNTEREIYRRLNVAQRQAPVSLGEQIGAVHTLGQVGKGVGRAFAGDVGGAGLDLLQAWAMRKLSKELKEMNTANRLIERTFRNYTRKPARIAP